MFHQWRWTANQVLSDYSRWSDTLEKDLVNAENLVLLQLRQVDGILHMWSWDKATRALESFRIFVGTPTLGDLITGSEEVTRVFRDATSVLSQTRWQRGVLQSYLQWRTSTTEALAKVEDCVVYSLRDPTGQLKQWRYASGHVLEKFGHWLTSDSNGDAPGSAMVQVLHYTSVF